MHFHVCVDKKKCICLLPPTCMRTQSRTHPPTIKRSGSPSLLLRILGVHGYLTKGCRVHAYRERGKGSPSIKASALCVSHTKSFLKVVFCKVTAVVDHNRRTHTHARQPWETQQRRGCHPRGCLLMGCGQMLRPVSRLQPMIRALVPQLHSCSE